MLYFDNAATTKISKSALESYNKASECFFNPSSLYLPSVESKKIVESARETLLKAIKGKVGSTLIFTGCATESNNTVLNSVITRKDKKYLIGAGEHSSIYFTAKKFKEAGYDIQFVPLKPNGGIDISKLETMLDDKVALLSVIYVSNETGAINNIKEITRLAKTKCPNIVVHTDAVQALGKVEINAKELNVDFLTLSAHKINGPKGIGALYVANPKKFSPFMIGGEQEKGMRAGTENIPAIASFETCVKELKPHNYQKHKQAFTQNLTGDYILVSDNECVDNIISVCFKGVRGETIEHMLEEKGYLIGTGSACNSKSGNNRVLSNIVPRDYIEGAVRISFGEEITEEDCKHLAIDLSVAVKQYIERIRR